MLKEMIAEGVKKFLNEKMPHALLPQVVYGKVTKGGDRKVNLRLLDRAGQIDKNYEEIPEVMTDLTLETGDHVIVSFLYGELETPVVLRKWMK